MILKNLIIYDFRILVLDIAIANTGWCIFQFSSKNLTFKIINFNTIVTGVGEDRTTRVRLILREVTQLISDHKINCVILEEPPDTIFGNGNANMIKGRAAKIFPVVAACYAVIGFCYSNGIFCRTMYPKQWQENGKQDSKTWSLQQARKVIEHVKFSKKLTSKDDHHAADAINIGIKTIRNFTDKKWILPNVQQDE